MAAMRSFPATNSAILVQGKISLRDDKAPQLMVDAIQPLAGSDAPAGRLETLYLRLPSQV